DAVPSDRYGAAVARHEAARLAKHPSPWLEPALVQGASPWLRPRGPGPSGDYRATERVLRECLRRRICAGAHSRPRTEIAPSNHLTKRRLPMGYREYLPRLMPLGNGFPAVQSMLELACLDPGKRLAHAPDQSRQQGNCRQQTEGEQPVAHW